MSVARVDLADTIYKSNYRFKEAGRFDGTTYLGFPGF
jgi:hypothetical protein